MVDRGLAYGVVLCDNRDMRNDATLPTRPQSADDYFLRATSDEHAPVETSKPARTFTKRADYVPRSIEEVMIGLALLLGFVLPLFGFGINWAVTELNRVSPALVAGVGFASIIVAMTFLRHFVDKHVKAPKSQRAK
jgi:hypothetical protein